MDINKGRNSKVGLIHGTKRCDNYLKVSKFTSEHFFFMLENFQFHIIISSIIIIIPKGKSTNLRRSTTYRL